MPPSRGPWCEGNRVQITVETPPTSQQPIFQGAEIALTRRIDRNHCWRFEQSNQRLNT